MLKFLFTKQKKPINDNHTVVDVKCKKQNVEKIPLYGLK